MKSIAQALDSTDVPRIRIGGPLAHPQDIALQEFTATEAERLPRIFGVVRLALELLVQGEPEKAKSLYNRRDIPVDELAELVAADATPKGAHGSP